MIKHFIDLSYFKKSELQKILNFAKKLKKNQIKYNSLLNNKSLGLIFEKQSTRTRISFSIGMQKLGGKVVELNKNQIGFGTRESAEDILKVMSQYLDVLMIRNDNHKQLSYLASLNVLPIINGLSNYSHPCQILSDIFTIEEILGKIEDKKVAWIGDFNNVLVSLVHAAEIFKFKLNVITPSKILKKNKNIFSNKKFNYVDFNANIEKGLKNVDCIMTDVWISMGEKNIKNKKTMLRRFQVNEKIMKKAKKNAIFMHCLPAHRNEEVTNNVIDGHQSVVWKQAQNRMYVQQSILNYLIK
tara:strand:+ start:816 stop:1712 length:897 start_codon:yes stop_codon:yes gene_type:complete